jgi:hypothetical protein
VKRIGLASDDGEDVPAIDGGDGLGTCLREARSRVDTTEDTVIDVDHVKFLNEREAVVWYTLSVSGNRYLHHKEGRAIQVNGQWLVTRASFCELMAMGGMTCPPPAD